MQIKGVSRLQNDLDLVDLVLFSDEDRQFRAAVRDFVEKTNLREEGVKSDKEGRYVSDIVIEEARKAGFFGIIIPEEYGGAGGTITQYVILAEEISRACFALSNILAVHNGLASRPIVRFGTEEQKQKYLPKLAKGDWIAGLGATEPNAGSNIAATSTTAIRVGESYIVNGRKTFITNGPIADVFVTLAYTNEKEREAKNPWKGMSMFIVEKTFPGFSTGTHFNAKLGLNAAPNSELIYDDMKVPAENLLGGEDGEGNGYAMMHDTMEGGRVFLAACTLGMAKEAFLHASKHAKTRKIGGEIGVPLSSYQVIQTRLAEMKEIIDAMHSFVYTTSKLMDKGYDVGRRSSESKVFCTRNAGYVIKEAILLHGGMGYMEELPLARLYREQPVTEIYEGTNDVLELLIAKEIFSKVD